LSTKQIFPSVPDVRLSPADLLCARLIILQPYHYQCEDAWPETIFSSFFFLEKCVAWSDLEWSDFVQLPRLTRIQRDLVFDKLERADDLELQSMWNEGQGVCTSWTILIGSKITPLPQYHIVDTGGHRLAFTESGILIDSSIRHAVQLQENIPPHQQQDKIYS
jgi:hypothetical protein